MRKDWGAGQPALLPGTSCPAGPGPRPETRPGSGQAPVSPPAEGVRKQRGGNVDSRERKCETGGGEGGGRAPRKRGPPFLVDFVEDRRSNTLRDKEAVAVLLSRKGIPGTKAGILGVGPSREQVSCLRYRSPCDGFCVKPPEPQGCPAAVGTGRLAGASPRCLGWEGRREAAWDLGAGPLGTGLGVKPGRPASS